MVGNVSSMHQIGDMCHGPTMVGNVSSMHQIGDMCHGPTRMGEKSLGTVDEHICMYLNAEMDDGPTHSGKHSGPSGRSRAQ
jgi:hypothetical protein